MKLITVSPEIEQEICRLYTAPVGQRVSIRKMGERFDISRTAVGDLLNQNGIKIRTNSEAQQRYLVNENYFKSICSHDVAQVFGFFLADGNCSDKGRFEISIGETDVDYLKQIKEAIQYNGPIGFKSKAAPQCQNVIRLCIGSRVFTDNLNNLGLVPRKSLVLTFPNQVPDEFVNSFVLGFFFGNGSLSIRPKGMKAQLSFCSTWEFCESLQALFKTKLNIHSRIYKRHKNRPVNSYTLVVGGNFNILNVCDWMFANCNESLRMERKWKKYYDLRSQYPEVLDPTTKPTHQGSKHHKAKINETQVLEIKRALKNGEMGAHLAAKYNVSPSTIYLIKKGKNWSHVTL